MIKIQYLRKTVRQTVCCMMLCGMLTGCGVRDAALTIPIGESEARTVKGVGTVAESQMSAETEDTERITICVYVCGAVENPGVVELPEGSRVDDALKARGGFTEEAQTDYVNLAAKVSDGEKLYFPSVEEAEALTQTKRAERDGMVNINTADLAKLMTLPGIGESKAQDIISYREAHGAFQNKEDIKKISGIKENVYSKICDKIEIQ